MNNELVGIGNVLVDIEVQVEDSFIEEQSLIKGGIKLSTSAETLVLNALLGRPTKISSGGSALNILIYGPEKKIIREK